MARRHKDRHTPEKRGIMAQIIREYDVKTMADIQNALKDLLGGTIEEMLEAEMDETLGFEKNGTTDEPKTDYRNGHKPKTLKSSMGKLEIDVPQDRGSEFEPKIVPKYTTDISEIEQKIINMYARGLTTREISEQIQDIYGFSASAELVSRVTDRVMPMIDDWQNRRLSEVYPIVYIDGIVFNVRKDKVVQKVTAYVVIGVDADGMKDVLTIEIGEAESAKFWLSVFNNMKNRGVKDILVVCSDGLTGIKEAINVAFPMADNQRCIVHMVRNTLQYVSYKHRKAYADALKTIYHAPDEESGYAKMLEVKDEWDKIYPNSMNRWVDNWDVICPMFKFSANVRRALYTTNAIESLNSQYRRINSSRPVFPTEDALKKAMYLATQIIIKKWTARIHNWGLIVGELSVMYEGRI